MTTLLDVTWWWISKRMPSSVASNSAMMAARRTTGLSGTCASLTFLMMTGGFFRTDPRGRARRRGEPEDAGKGCMRTMRPTRTYRRAGQVPAFHRRAQAVRGARVRSRQRRGDSIHGSWLWLNFCDAATLRHANRTRLRRSWCPARPNIWRLSILIRLTWPSTAPELQGRVRPAMTASRSRSMPAARV